MNPVRGQEWIQYGGSYGSSTGTIMDLVRGHLWITGTLMDAVRGNLWIQYGDTNGSSTWTRMDPVRGHLWIQYGGTYG